MIPSARWYPDLATQSLAGLTLQTQPAFTHFVDGLANIVGMDFTFIQIAAALEPAPLSPDILIALTPYARPEALIEQMLACAGRSWFTQKNGKFYLTEKGQQAVGEMLELGDGLFAKIEVLPNPQMERLLTLLTKVSDKIKILPEPVEKPVFGLSQCFDRGPSVPLLAQIRRRMIDLLAFRDDAHMAAWQTHETEGQLWEAFTFVWRNQASTAAELAEQLSHRNYDEAAYAAALEKLVARGWVIARDGKYVVRPGAAKMRQAVEEMTDQFYDLAFNALDAAEMGELQNLMTRFAQAVTPAGEGS